MRPSEIACRLNRPRSTISSSLRKASQLNNGNSDSRSGRPKQYTKCDRRHILMMVKKQPFMKWKELLRYTPVQKTQVYHILRQSNMKKWIAKGRPLLTKAQAKERSRWAQAHKRWSWKRWARVIWSDECSVERGKGKRKG